jgi:hypothetical protein
VAYFGQLHDDLVPGGRLVIVDFYKRRLPVGPPPELKVDQSQIAREVTSAGYRVVQRDDELPYQYILVFEVAEQNESG